MKRLKQPKLHRSGSGTFLLAQYMLFVKMKHYPTLEPNRLNFNFKNFLAMY